MPASSVRLLVLFCLCGLASTATTIERIVEVWEKSPDSEVALFPFLEDGKVGFINAFGKVVVKPKVEAAIQDVADFSEGLAAVTGREKSGFVDQNGEWRIEGDYIWVQSFSDGLAYAVRRAANGFERVYIDHAGAVILSLGDLSGEDFHEGLAAFEAKGKPGIRRFGPEGFVSRDFHGLMGYVDKSGKLAIEPRFAEAGRFSGGLARVVLDGYCHRLRPDGAKWGSPTSGYLGSFGAASEDAVEPCPVGFIDKSGAFKIRPVLESARDFLEGLAPARMDGKWGYLDRDGSWVIEPRFEEAWNFHEDLAAVKQDGRWGFIDKQGEFQIQPQYSWVSRFSGGVAVVLDGDQSQFIDSNGSETMAGDFRFRTFLSQGLAAVRLDKETVAYIDRGGEVVFTYKARRGQ